MENSQEPLIHNSNPADSWQGLASEAKNIIGEAKNICIIPSENSEAITSALALFYTLKELNKNVNLIIEKIPEKLNFLGPSLDFISYPKNFVISIPNKVASVSQVYYEKNDQALKIHLTLENGSIKKDNISFYFSETRPDLVIALGIKNYSKELTGRLNSFGFLLDSPILNIDTSTDLAQAEMDPSTGSVQKNKNFGKINLIKDSSLSETVFGLIKNINENSIKKDSARCLLAGIVIYTKNFKNELTAEIFEMAGSLMKSGANLKEITNSLTKSEAQNQKSETNLEYLNN